MNINEYERLTKLYIDSVYRVALNGCKSPHDAEDVTQTTFLKLWQHKNGFEDDEHAKRWLIRVAVNECNTLWRSPWRKNTLPLEDLPKEPIFSSPEKSELYYAVKELPTKYRVVIYLYYFEGYSTKETADILGISKTAVQTRLLRARQYLKDRLKEAWQ
ncbi:MAG: sigma-70 family RNA polymerase sigma factor [Oscillospiraceae bacterium]|nr:sigma-70 family RNA polymerase sigma factor [Oscillospiraceae bacterium]